MIIKTFMNEQGYIIEIKEDNFVIPMSISKKDFNWDKVGEVIMFGIKLLKEKKEMI